MRFSASRADDDVQRVHSGDQLFDLRQFRSVVGEQEYIGRQPGTAVEQFARSCVSERAPLYASLGLAPISSSTDRILRSTVLTRGRSCGLCRPTGFIYRVVWLFPNSRRSSWIPPQWSRSWWVTTTSNCAGFERFSSSVACSTPLLGQSTTKAESASIATVA